MILAVGDWVECAFLSEENQQQIGALGTKVIHELKVAHRAISDFLVRNSLTNKVSIDLPSATRRIQFNPHVRLIR